MGGTFSMSKVLSLLKGFLSNVSSPLPGFDMGDVKVNTQGDVYSALFQFKAENGTEVGGLTDESGGELTNISGKKIPLTVLIKAVNFQATFSPILSGLNNIGVRRQPASIKAR